MSETVTEAARICSYSDIFTMGHKALAELFDGEVLVEEKVDGSQISFGRLFGRLFMRSKGKQLQIDAPEKMFSEAVASVQDIFDQLPGGLVFRGEYFKSPKHNTLAYSRIPNKHIIIFDIDRGNQDYLTVAEKTDLAASLGFETVPTIFQGLVTSVDQIKSFLPEASILGGARPEGVVLKNYKRLGHDKKILMGKYVRPEFREAHATEWKKTNPVQSDIIDSLIDSYKTEARWEKAVQHLRDAGLLEQSPKDIAALLNEVERDIEKECEAAIKDTLWRWAWPKVARGAKAGLPEWYKNQLLENAIKVP